jgi:hypothetical protein
MTHARTMSEPERLEDRQTRWRSFGRVLVLLAALGWAGILLFLVLIDPFDTGRLVAHSGPPGVSAQGPGTANASRGRDPRFRVAIIGNSTAQLLEPAAIGREIGAPVTSLVIGGSGPEEQLAVADWVLRSHREPPLVALIFGLDGSWCTAGASLRGPHPFPFWIYGRSTLDYLIGLARLSVLRRAPARVTFLLGRGRRAPARPDGFWDYDPEFRRLGYTDAPAKSLDRPGGPTPVNLTGHFPAIEALVPLLATVPQETVVVLLRPPVFITGLPTPGTGYDISEHRCRERLQAVAASRARTALIDWRVDRPENRVAANFYDHVHYRRDLARALEQEIAAAINRLRSEPATH